MWERDEDMASDAIAERSDLALHATHVTLRGLETLASRELPRLRGLSLYMLGLGPGLVEPLLAAPWRTQLVSLNVCGNRLGAAGMQALMAHPWPHLTTLAAGYDELGDAGAVAVADAALPALARLNLRDNGIGPTGARALADRYAPQLVDLGLEDNALGPAGVAALADAPFTRLERIDVRDNDTDQYRLADAPWAAGVRARGGLVREGASERSPPPDESGPVWRVRLAIISGPGAPPREEVLVGRRLTMGRSPQSDLVLDALNVARRHARLEGQGEHLYLVDNGSSNGTYCNGEQVVRHLLRPGDEVWLGWHRLRVVTMERV